MKHAPPLLPTVAALAFSVAACAPATGGDPEFWSPLLGGGGAGAASVTSTSPSTGGAAMTTTTSHEGGSGGTSGTGGGVPAGPTAGELTVDFTTVSFGGKYAPDNVVAVWITDDQGAFVKTLGVFATKRAKYLVTWLADSGGNTVDAVTGATFAAHGPRSVKWDSTGTDGKLVPDGSYRAHMEFTEQNKLGKVTFVPFTKGPLPTLVSPPDEPYFKDIHVGYAP
jgi:hypothetical protein